MKGFLVGISTSDIFKGFVSFTVSIIRITYAGSKNSKDSKIFGVQSAEYDRDLPGKPFRREKIVKKGVYCIL